MREIFVDTIRKTGGSLGTDIRVKNTSVYESDGGTSVTQNLVQGIGKSWISHDFGSDNSANDSFNVSSTTDNSTANMDITFSNPMSNSNYSILVGQRLVTALNGVYYTYNVATTKFVVYGRYNQAYYEWSPQYNLTMGDLA